MGKTAFILLIGVACALAAPSSDLAWRIIGGEKAHDGDFPYQVSIKQDGYHICGGSIIDVPTPHILTAAHCVYKVDIKSLTVVMGTNKLNEGGTVYKVASTVIHPTYPILGGDIALVRLTEAIEINDNVGYIELATGSTEANVECVLTGWGTTLTENTPNDLQWIPLKTHDLELCKAAHPKRKVFDTDICTLTKKGEGACFGDSGSPLVNRQRQQIGIVSWGEPCAQGKPDVYTRVESYIDWISENVL